ncbi:hypothetical protein PIB30_001157 [Stylosanthes scabra]|uniref:Uncharacterized protein n=1 Tax=Stylosanthes scabra TaxID=79078 RepID=A0ABU6V4J2_9FABA|nr:hypothetical protein [Stylosanthes scabra]
MLTIGHKKNNDTNKKDNVRMVEVEAMRFSDLQHIANRIVQQELYMHLASNFDLDNNLIKHDIDNIEVNATIVEIILNNLNQCMCFEIIYVLVLNLFIVLDLSLV